MWQTNFNDSSDYQVGFHTRSDAWDWVIYINESVYDFYGNKVRRDLAIKQLRRAGWSVQKVDG